MTSRRERLRGSVRRERIDDRGDQIETSRIAVRRIALERQTKRTRVHDDSPFLTEAWSVRSKEYRARKRQRIRYVLRSDAISARSKIVLVRSDAAPKDDRRSRLKLTRSRISGRRLKPEFVLRRYSALERGAECVVLERGTRVAGRYVHSEKTRTPDRIMTNESCPRHAIASGRLKAWTRRDRAATRKDFDRHRSSP